MTAVEHIAPTPRKQPNLVGDRVEILCMSERGTILADAYVTAVSPREDGRYGVNAVMSDASASFHLVPGGEDAPSRATIRPSRRHRPGHVIQGVDHTKPTE